MATAWSFRSNGYKYGVGGLLFGFLCYLLGFVLPLWITAENANFGLWLVCAGIIEIETDCKATVSSIKEDRGFQAVQVLECLGLAGLVASSLSAVIINCRHATPPHHRILGALAAFSGVLGFISCMVFVGKTTGIDKTIDMDYGWGFYLNLAGSIFVVLSAVAIGNGGRSSLANQTTAGAVIGTGGTPTMQGINTVVVQQGVIYPAPAALGAQPAYGYDQGVSVAAQYPGGFPPAPPQAGYYAAPAAYGGKN